MKAQEILIAHPSTASEVNTLKAFLKVLKIKFEVAKESPYNAAFVAKVEKTLNQAKAKQLQSAILKNYRNSLIARC
jgi:hypothetical protein